MCLSSKQSINDYKKGVQINFVNFINLGNFTFCTKVYEAPKK